MFHFSKMLVKMVIFFVLYCDVAFRRYSVSDVDLTGLILMLMVMTFCKNAADGLIILYFRLNFVRVKAG